MALKTAPYGSWESPITVESVASKSRTLSAPRVAPRSGRAFYVETREVGGRTIMEITVDGLKNVLPAKYSASNTVYEYGGSPYAVLPDDQIVFSNKDNTVHILNPDTQEVSLLTQNINQRYSNFEANSKSSWVLAVEEDHTNDAPDKVRNRVVAINTESNEVKRILETADFYYTPSFSPDGEKLAWLEWDHPDLPFDASKLYWAEWQAEGVVSNIQLISGNQREGVAEPRWGPDGSLFFGQEKDGYRRLFRIPPGESKPVEIKLDKLDCAEFGEIRWFQGSHTYAPLSHKHLIAAPALFGTSKLILVDLETGSWDPLASSSIITEVMFDAVSRLDDTSCLVIGSGSKAPQTLYRFDVEKKGSFEKVRDSTEEVFPDSVYSEPESFRIRSTGSPDREIHGFLWMPHNPDFTAPADDIPPLIMLSHGGPTAYMGSGLKLRVQYFTSRGYACFALNHAGSTGFGREYRESLFGRWGLIDSDDAAECAQYLIAQKRVKSDGVGITGVSAGGYNTLQSLVRHPKTFSGGVCLSGVSDIKRLDDSTHKLESDYMDHLVLLPGGETDKEKVYHDRSPLFHADQIEAPLLLLHGTLDKIVPLDQAEFMADAIKKKGGDVKMIIADNEAHGFFQAANVRKWLIEEEKWWRRTLLKSETPRE